MKVKGFIKDKVTSSGLSNIAITASLYIDQSVSPIAISEATSDQQGNFELDFEDNLLSDPISRSKKLSLKFKLIDGNTNKPLSTSTTVPDLLNIANGGLTITATKEAVAFIPQTPSSPSIPTIEEPKVEPVFYVKGFIRQPAGEGIDNLTITVYHKALRKKEVLIEDIKTDSNGYYYGSYLNESLISSSDDINLYIEVKDDLGNILTTKTKFNARPQEDISLTLNYKKESDFDKIETDLLELLDTNNLSVEELEDDDIDYIANTKKIRKRDLKYKVQAKKLSNETELPEWFHFSMERKGITADIESLLNTPLKHIKETLEKSQEEKIIPTQDKDKVKEVADKIINIKTQHILGKPPASYQLKNNTFFDLAKLDDNEKNNIINELVEKESPINASNIKSSGINSLDEKKSKRLEFTFDLADLAEESEPLMSRVLSDNKITSKKDLARRYNREHWETLLNETEPDSLETHKDRALLIHHKLLNEYPEEVLLREFSSSDNTILASNPGIQVLESAYSSGERFNFAERPITVEWVNMHVKYTDDPNLSADENKKKKSTRQKKGKQTLEVLQRLLKLTNDPQVARILFQDGFSSAMDIVNMGRTRFVKLYRDHAVIGERRATDIYNIAEHIIETVVAIGHNNSASRDNTPISVIHSPIKKTDSTNQCPSEFQNNANYKQLFGSQDSCACEPCESVYSPAAYLTDLLDFIKREVKRKADSNVTQHLPANGLEALDFRSYCDADNQLVSKRTRRPDIAGIKLSCDNAEDEVSYLDLVLEILEKAVNPDEPEKAYETLQQACFPFSLPFDRSQKEADLYLESLSINKHRLLEAFHSFNLEDKYVDSNNLSNRFELYQISAWNSEDLIKSRLGMSDKDWELLTNESNDDIHKCWGFENIDNNEKKWYETLSNASVFLKKSRLNHKEFIEITLLQSINANKKISIKFNDENDVQNCNLDKAKISGLDESSLDKLYKFIRLKNILGISYRELDLILFMLFDKNEIKFNKNLFKSVSHILILKDKFSSLPMEELTSWWGNINTNSYQTNERSGSSSSSLYDDIFSPLLPLSSLDNNTYIKDEIPNIAKSIEVREDDIKALINNLAPSSHSELKLNLENLSLVYRHFSLSKKLRVKISEYIRLKSLIGFDPFLEVSNAQSVDYSMDGTLQTLRFVTYFIAAKESGLTISELEYLASSPNGDTVFPESSLIEELKEQITAIIAKDKEKKKDSLSPEELKEIIIIKISEKLETNKNLIKVLFDTTTISSSSANIEETLSKEIIKTHKSSLLVNALNIFNVEADTDFDKILRKIKFLLKLTKPNGKEEIPLDNIITSINIFKNASNILSSKLNKFDYFSDENKSDIELFLINLADWEIDNLFDDNSKIKYERDLARFPLINNYFSNLKISANELSSWAANLASNIEEMSKKLKLNFKSTWKEKDQEIQDTLREQRRKALVEYLLHKWNLDKPDDLTDHFLIDVKMGACMKTSRIIQASASIQLFVQRLIMNLEPGLSLTLQGAKQWEWKKNYRIWEANRKVFLYPENYIEADLRDDKTPFFKELEAEILQSELTDETAEIALVNYLEKLNDVARLQICAQYLEENTSPMTLHVFARTKDIPHRYYYRKGFLTGRPNSPIGNVDVQRWTHWESVDVDIEGDHLIPVVFNRRVYLFWPIFISEDVAPYSTTLEHLFKLYEKVVKITLSLNNSINTLIANISKEFIETNTSQINKSIKFIEDGFNLLKNTFHLPIPGTPRPLDINFPKLDINIDIIDEILKSSKNGKYHDINKLLIEIESFKNNYEDYVLSMLPSKDIEIQLSWSEFRGSTWSKKKTSSNVVKFNDSLSTLMELLPDFVGSKKPINNTIVFASSTKGQKLSINTYLSNPSYIKLDSNFEWITTTDKIGDFNLDVCSNDFSTRNFDNRGKVEDILKSIFNYISENLSGSLQIKHRGYPITIDDDYDTPSLLRKSFQFSDDKTYRVIARRQSGDYTFEIERINKSSRELDKCYSHCKDNEFQLRLMGKSVNDCKRQCDDTNSEKHTKEKTISTDFNLNGVFYQNEEHIFFCIPRKKYEKFIFINFYHPYSCMLLKSIQEHGVSGIYEYRFSDLSLKENKNGKLIQHFSNEFFKERYPGYDNVSKPFPIEQFDFSPSGSYSIYNWEVFFHIPLLIASKLSTDQKFKEAQKWFHYIFNPTDTSSLDAPQKYWRTKPFFTATQQQYHDQSIYSLLVNLNKEAEEPGEQEHEKAVSAWKNDAFNPHHIARMRITAFQKAIVMKYIDNLIARGDYLFRLETRESVNEAMHLYILADKILGVRPNIISRKNLSLHKNFKEIESDLGAYSNALVRIENTLKNSELNVDNSNKLAIDTTHKRQYLPKLIEERKLPTLYTKNKSAVGELAKSISMGNTLSPQKSLYFCIPPNHTLFGKWDTVYQRLSNIRNCKNIDGKSLNLSLLAPSIDPSLLVRAKSLGMSVDDVLADQNIPLPHYRFNVLLGKANELCNHVKSFGSMLLSAIEKRDSEALSILRNNQEIDLLNKVTKIKESQIKSAQLSKEGLIKSKESADKRNEHYQNLLNEYISPEEVLSSGLNITALRLQVAAFEAKFGSATSSLLPDVKAGFVTTLGTTYGGKQVGDSTSRISDSWNQISSMLNSTSSLVSTMGSYRRRGNDWQLQIDTTKKEIENLEKQILAADIRLAISKIELENHKLQIENSKGIRNYMQEKFSNEDLYDWMVSEVSKLYFSTYKLALKIAKKAEKAAKFELGEKQELSIIPFSQWNSLKKGLLSGEQLQLALNQLETYYLENNERLPELKKSISLAQINPLALLDLKNKAECEFTFPEILFDLDFPGHYLRRIKYISISIPCVAGPYTSISATLRQIESKIRFKPELEDNENVLLTNYGGSNNQSICTSTGQNDSGMFELNFRDERYLPFEGTGVISTWALELPSEFRQFDYNTISDIIIHIGYTAKYDEQFKSTVTNGISERLQGEIEALSKDNLPLTRIIDLKAEFPTEYLRLKKGEEAELTITRSMFPYIFSHYIKLKEGNFSYSDNINIKIKANPSDNEMVLGSISLKLEHLKKINNQFIIRIPYTLKNS